MDGAIIWRGGGMEPISAMKDEDHAAYKKGSMQGWHLAHVWKIRPREMGGCGSLLVDAIGLLSCCQLTTNHA